MSLDSPPAKWRSISLLALCQVLAMALWFSASAVIPALTAEFGLKGWAASLLASSIAVGFVAGTFSSALLGLADRLDPRRFFTAAAAVAAVANGLILVVPPTSWAVPALRFVVGAAMAGVYPVGMKMASSWANSTGGRADMGLLVGLLVGALTLGSASPHLIGALGGLDWRFTLGVASGLAALSAALINLVALGPNRAPRAEFKARFVLRAWSHKPLRLANLGYFGHMWELYAMWAWIGVFLHASFAINPGGQDAAVLAKIAAFATIGIGALGCLLGGVIADRWGRTTLTMAAMAISGSCALAVGFLYGANPWLLTAACLVWGVAVIADSAQFSASVMELSDPAISGTMVTVQTCIGFLLTTLTIHLIPELVEYVGWRFAFAALAVGPFLGVVAMAALRARPEAVKLAAGKR